MTEHTQPPHDEAANPGNAVAENLRRITASMGGHLALDGSQYQESSASYQGLPPIEQLPEQAVLIGEGIRATPGADTEDLAVEAKRSGLSVACVMDVYNGDFTRFPNLTPEQQQQLQEQVRRAMPDQESLDAFLLLLLTHDFGKKDEIRAAVEAGEDIDHDEVYTRMVTYPEYEAVRQRYMPSFDLLTPEGQRLLKAVARMRTNYPQSLQGEAPADTLEDFHNEPDLQVRILDILKAKFDIFGAAGHVNSDISLTATAGTARRMHNLDTALLRPDLATPQERNNAYLDAETAHFMPGAEPRDEAERNEWRALARLELPLRVDSQEAFDALRADFDGLPPVSKALLVHELNRATRATLAYYSPILLRTLTKKVGQAAALEYFAHILQEAHIADQKARKDGLPGISVVQAEAIVRDLQSGKLDPRTTAVRFMPNNGALVGTHAGTSIDNLDGVQEYQNGESLRGKRVVFLGEGGGSDGIQAAMVSRLFAEKYGCEVAAVVSTRSSKRKVTNTGEQIGQATKRITPDTKAVGKWRYLENIPLEDEPDTPHYLLNSTETDVVTHDVKALLAETNADVVVGIDTGGDSLYRNLHSSFSAHLPTDITPDHDYEVISGLNRLSEENPNVEVLSVIVAPGVDSPAYGREMIDTIGGERVPLSEEDIETINRTYAGWGMDGSRSEEGRFGKTPLAWLHALNGRFGFQRLDVPKADVTSDTNPWRAFTTITPAMAGVVITKLSRHFNAIRRAPTEKE